jgi:hypothetical protein
MMALVIWAIGMFVLLVTLVICVALIKEWKNQK